MWLRFAVAVTFSFWRFVVVHGARPSCCRFCSPFQHVNVLCWKYVRHRSRSICGLLLRAAAGRTLSHAKPGGVSTTLMG